MHTIAYTITCLLIKLVVFPFIRIHILHRERSRYHGGVILAGNHISHFDPPLLSAVALRKIDWMAMAELFENRWTAAFFRAVDTFPTRRGQVDRMSVRTALKRLNKGRMVGIFPEGGLRAGKESVLGDAPMRPGVSALANMAQVPIVPFVIIGSDRLYSYKSWIPFRRVHVWIAFGEPVSSDMERETLGQHLKETLQKLLKELSDTYNLSEDDLPQIPQRRKGKE